MTSLSLSSTSTTSSCLYNRIANDTSMTCVCLRALATLSILGLWSCFCYGGLILMLVDYENNNEGIYVLCLASLCAIVGGIATIMALKCFWDTSVLIPKTSKNDNPFDYLPLMVMVGNDGDNIDNNDQHENDFWTCTTPWKRNIGALLGWLFLYCGLIHWRNHYLKQNNNEELLSVSMHLLCLFLSTILLGGIFLMSFYAFPQLHDNNDKDESGNVHTVEVALPVFHSTVLASNHQDKNTLIQNQRLIATDDQEELSPNNVLNGLNQT